MNEAERSALAWPQHQPRTRVQDQKHNGAWKKSWGQYSETLELELKRMGVTRYVVTFNGPGARDPGVAVWFDRQKGDDYRWQDILGIDNPYPTVNQVEDYYRRLAPGLHPDRNPNADPAKFAELTEARRQAIAWVKGTIDLPKGYVIASDQWKEPRQNLYAIIGTIQSLRRIERLGATQLFEGALQGFAGVLPEKASEAIHV